MTNLKRRLQEDRALRDAAREVIDLDIQHVKSIASPENLRGRTIAPVSDKAQQMRDDAVSTANNNKGRIAAIIGATASAAILWAVRKPLLALIEDLTKPATGDEAALPEKENP